MELNPSANISVCITSMKTEIVKKDVIDEIQFILIFWKNVNMKIQTVFASLQSSFCSFLWIKFLTISDENFKYETRIVPMP